MPTDDAPPPQEDPTPTGDALPALELVPTDDAPPLQEAPPLDVGPPPESAPKSAWVVFAEAHDVTDAYRHTKADLIEMLADRPVLAAVDDYPARPYQVAVDPGADQRHHDYTAGGHPADRTRAAVGGRGGLTDG